jgi:hypothetical protein
MPYEIPDGWLECEEAGCECYFCTTCGLSYSRIASSLEHEIGGPVGVVHYVTDESEA